MVSRLMLSLIASRSFSLGPSMKNADQKVIDEEMNEHLDAYLDKYFRKIDTVTITLRLTVYLLVLTL